MFLRSPATQRGVHLLSLEALSRSLHPLIKDAMNQSALKNQAKKVTADCTEMVLNTNKMHFSLSKT
jgi:hypothetical protein